MVTIIWPYLLPYLLSLSITIAIGGYAWKRRSVSGNPIFAMTMFAEASWIFGYIFELISPSLVLKIFWDDFQFIGTLIAPVLLLVYILQYTGLAPMQPRRLLVNLLVTPGIFLAFLFTNPWHGLVRHQSWIGLNKPFNTLSYDFTWPMWLIFIYIYMIYLAGVAILFRYLLRQHRVYRMQRILLFIGISFPFIGSLFSISGINIMAQRDASPLFFAIGNIFLAWGLFRFGLFDITPVARDTVIENMSDLVIIMDPYNRIVDINPAACEAIGLSTTSAIGVSIEQLLIGKLNLVTHKLTVSKQEDEMTLQGLDGKPHYFDLHITNLQDDRNKIIGRIWVAHDITERKQAEINLNRARDELEARIQERTTDLSAVNETLRVERDFAQQVMTTMGQGLTVTDSNGLFEYVNPAFAEMLGWQPQDIVGKSPAEVTYEEDLPLLQEALVARQQGQTTNYETNLMHANGSFIQVLITGVPRFHNGNFSGTVAVVTDLTERKRTERVQTAIYRISEAVQTTQNPEDFFRLIREIVSGLMPTRNLYVALYDPINDLLNFAIRNDDFRAPMTPQKLGKGITAYVLRTGMPLLATPEILEKLVAEGEVDRLGNQRVDWLGVPLKTSKGIIGVMAAHTFSEGDRLTEEDKDLLNFVATQVATAIERKQAEEALRLSEERYRALVENLPNSAVLLFDRGYNIVLVDGPEIDLLGYSKAQLEGKQLRDALPVEYFQFIEPGMHNALDDKNSTIEFTLRNNFYHLTFLPIKDGTDTISYGMILLQNTTIRKQAETEREKLINELENKNAELERFTYTVSHDLKSPLITIRGYLGFLEKDAIAGNIEQMKSDQARIVEATNKMQRLLSELLELSRIGRMINPPRIVPFNEIVDEAISLVSGRIQERGITIRIADGLPAVYGDRARLVEVMQNLIDNACKFMGNQIDPCIEIGQLGVENEGKPIFFVRDNGIGIETDYYDKIFGLFNKLDAQSEGTGVGLALVKRIIEVHEGKIWIESEGLGKGTTFFFTISQSEQ